MNFIGAGASIGDNDDFADFAILSKIRLLEFPVAEDRAWSLSARPCLAFSNGLIDLRLPATIEFKQPTVDSDEPGDRLAPFAGEGVAVTLKEDDESRFDFMLTGGIDYLLTPDWTLTGMVNLLFLSDINVEGAQKPGFFQKPGFWHLLDRTENRYIRSVGEEARNPVSKRGLALARLGTDIRPRRSGGTPALQI